ncbi:MAG: thioredoxin family protein [Pirellulaceae bacterium]
MFVRFSVAALAIFAILSITSTASAIDTFAETVDYETAYHRAQTDQKPLLVLVTAEWCQPCQKMKETTIAEMLGNEALQDVHFATVDVDNDEQDAKNLIGDGAVPQLILFERDGSQWQWRRVEGYQTVAQVEAFLDPTQAEINQQGLDEEMIQSASQAVAAQDSLDTVDYETAYTRAVKDEKPLLVLVTSESCAPCEQLKTNTLADMIADREFDEMHFASVVREESPEDAESLIGDGAVPQLVLYEKKDGMWHSRSVKGFQTVAQVQAFLEPTTPISTTAIIAQNNQVTPSYVTSPQPMTSYPVISQPTTINTPVMGTTTYPMHSAPMNYSAPMGGYGGYGGGYSGGYSGGFSGGFSSGGC